MREEVYTKVCTGCKRELTSIDFYKRTAGKGGIWLCHRHHMEMERKYKEVVCS